MLSYNSVKIHLGVVLIPCSCLGLFLVQPPFHAHYIYSCEQSMSGLFFSSSLFQLSCCLFRLLSYNFILLNLRTKAFYFNHHDFNESTVLLYPVKPGYTTFLANSRWEEIYKKKKVSILPHPAPSTYIRSAWSKLPRSAQSRTPTKLRYHLG